MNVRSLFMKKNYIFIFFALLFCFGASKSFADEKVTFGVVSFGDCISDSKYGKHEQESLEKLREQMSTLINDYTKQLNDLATKFNDREFVDSLSPEAEQEMKAKFQSLSEELNQYQNQSMQVLQQANMQLVQSMGGHVQKASEVIAKQKKIAMVVNKEAFFYYNPSLDITSSVIKEMDKNFEADNGSDKSSEQEKK